MRQRSRVGGGQPTVLPQPGELMPEPVTVRAVDRVVATLRAGMFDGTLSPGDRIAEVEVAERLGVSRTPVREAIGRLAAEGLLDLQPNRGARVVSWSPEQLAEIFDLRLQLETRAARLAAAQISADQIGELHELAEQMMRVGKPGRHQDIPALHAANRRFHDLLVGAAGRPTLTAALSTAIHTAVIRHNFEIYDDASMLRSLHHHQEIVAALRARDGDWAEAVMRSHLCNARAALLAEGRTLTDETERN
jgi:DNA-binding GntR family transcriptional regulator